MKIINRKTIVYIIAFAVFALLYLFTEARFIAMALIMLILMAIGGSLCIIITGKDLKGHLECPVQGYRQQDIPVSFKVRNNSRIPVLMCMAELEVKNLLTEETHRLIKGISVGHSKEAQIDFTMKSDFSGCMQVSIKQMRVADPFAIFTRHTGEIVDSFARAYIMPTGAGAELTTEEMNSFDMESYKYSSTSKGNDSSEVFNIKEYEIGDNYKSIHWKLSTKMDDLLIKESSLPIENKVMIIVDKEMAEVSEKKVDEYTGFAASLSFTMLHKEMYHTIGWYDYNSGKFESFRVDSDDSYWLAMKGLIECPYRSDGESAVSHFAETDIIKEFSNYVLISENDRDIEELAAYGAVKTYKPEDYR